MNNNPTNEDMICPKCQTRMVRKEQKLKNLFNGNIGIGTSAPNNEEIGFLLQESSTKLTISGTGHQTYDDKDEIIVKTYICPECKHEVQTVE